MTGIPAGTIRIAHSRELKTSATIQQENRILTPGTVRVQSHLRALNAGISHGVILMIRSTKDKIGKNDTGLSWKSG
jgi:hypothetical protein